MWWQRQTERHCSTFSLWSCCIFSSCVLTALSCSHSLLSLVWHVHTHTNTHTHSWILASTNVSESVSDSFLRLHRPRPRDGRCLCSSLCRPVSKQSQKRNQGRVYKYVYVCVSLTGADKTKMLKWSSGTIHAFQAFFFLQLLHVVWTQHQSSADRAYVMLRVYNMQWNFILLYSLIQGSDRYRYRIN